MPDRRLPQPAAYRSDSADEALRHSRRALLALVTATAVAFAWAAAEPHDRGTWWLESLPVIGIVAVLWATRRRFPLTPLLYALVTVALVMLCVGAHYTFERVPVGEWVQSAFGLRRNPYDRFGHVLQGLVPAIALREVLVRRSPLGDSRWLVPAVVAGCLAISAAYELVEWGIALLIGARAEAFLGMQGDRWDAQWDMLCALAGAVLALVVLATMHDRALARLRGAGGRGIPVGAAATRAGAT